MKDPGALAPPSVKNVKNVMKMNKLFNVQKQLPIVSKTSTIYSLIARRNKIALKRRGSERLVSLAGFETLLSILARKPIKIM